MHHLSMSPEFPVHPETYSSAVTSNYRFSLDGATLLRFVRGFATGAGLEYDVAMINRALCERFALHIIQIHMVLPGESLAWVETTLGRGRVTTIPLPRAVLPVNPPKQMAFIPGIKRWVRDRLVFNPLTGSAIARWYGTLRPRARPGDVIGVGQAVRKVLRAHQVALVAVHAAGGSDAWEAIHEARLAGLPVSIQLHFANERFRDFSVRVQVAHVDRVGGVSGVNVPSYLSGHFTNLLTAVDTRFFNRAEAASSHRFRRPVLILPARIVPTKGHRDLVEIVKLLDNWGIAVEVAFAGRADQPDHEIALRRQIDSCNLSDRFHFLGMMNPDQLRNLYSTCTLLAFPTYHQEGLPRILLEAQAMELPVVVYDSGGSRAGLIPNKTGFLVPPGHLLEFARSTRVLIENASLARSFGSEGRQFVETEFGLSSLADRHEKFIAATLSAHASRIARSVRQLHIDPLIRRK